MHPALKTIRRLTERSDFENDLFLVGGAVRDELLLIDGANDFDLVTRGSSATLAQLLFESGVCEFSPVTYERFGTAMVRIAGSDIEIVTARKESYDEESRKPNVEPATYLEDALRRDFTVNTLMRSLHSGQLVDPTGLGLQDLEAKVLRTPLEPEATFYDDPLRMLRAVRFRWKLGFEPASSLYEAIRNTKDRLKIISFERIRDELQKMLKLARASNAFSDLMELGLLDEFAPELRPMVGCEQGPYHHLDVWDHSLLVLQQVGPWDEVVCWAALLHDIAKPPTGFVDQDGNTRFFGHETMGADLAATLLRRLKLPQREIDQICLLIKNHMRLGSSPEFSATAARRLIRDLGDNLEQLLVLVDADASSLKPGVRLLNLEPIRARIAEVQSETPLHTLQSPLSGQEIMKVLNLKPGKEVGKIKDALLEQVLEGKLAPGDKDAAYKELDKYKSGQLSSS